MANELTDVTDLSVLLRKTCAEYAFEPVAIFKRSGNHPWPLIAEQEADLESQLADGGHFLPLPREPAALANVIEVAVVDFLIDRFRRRPSVELTRGTERGYPDIEFQAFGKYFAVDVKVARRGINKKGSPTGKTDSRITLYTGNTFFLHPKIHWPGTFRPFSEYAGHLDIICIYTLDPESPARVRDFELIVAEPWKIASRHRSSTTREYLGAVQEIERLRQEAGDFSTSDEFYTFWRKHPWKIGRAVQKLLIKLTSEPR